MMTMQASDVTARVVAMHHGMGTAERRRRVPLARYPHLIEADYAAHLVSFVHEWRREVQQLLDALPQLLASARMDESPEGRRARSLLERGRSAVTRHTQTAPYVARRYAEEVSQHHKRELARQTKAALGVEVPTADRGIRSRMEHFADEAVSKIRGLGDRTMDGLEQTIAEGFTSGQTVDELTAEIAKRFDIVEGRARRIARDTIAKLDGQVTRLRHDELGISTFIWMTRADGKVRPHHAVKHKRIFPYAGSRAPSFFPGEERGCRCRQVPNFEEIKIKAGIGAGRQRVA